MDQTDETLERLMSSGRCTCENSKEYAEQLRQLAVTEVDRDTAKKRGRFYKALGDETRQRILGVLLARELCVCELIAALGMTQPTTSHHLKILEDAGLIRSKRDGRWIFYGVKDKTRVSSLLTLAIE
jgi:ArsR family transcriptional regulator, arsenate/arsenite/antimonite-responsive transcriptional repressor